MNNLLKKYDYEIVEGGGKGVYVSVLLLLLLSLLTHHWDFENTCRSMQSRFCSGVGKGQESSTQSKRHRKKLLLLGRRTPFLLIGEGQGFQPGVRQRSLFFF